eukprot:1159363-Pelagomonas_calceolata.AAC.5
MYSMKGFQPWSSCAPCVAARGASNPEALVHARLGPTGNQRQKDVQQKGALRTDVCHGLGVCNNTDDSAMGWESAIALMVALWDGSVQ